MGATLTQFQTLDIIFLARRSTFHAMLYPKGRTLNLWQLASMQQNDAIATLLHT